MASRRPSVRWLAAFGAAALAGCNAAPVVPPPAGAGPTGGLGIELWHARTDTRQYEYFVVLPDGALSYGGGIAGFERRTEWTGRLTDEEGARLRRAVDAAGWLTAADPSADRGATPIAEILLRVPGGERKVRIAGTDASVDEAVGILAAASRRRFDRFMQRLPDAGVQPAR